MHALPWVGWVAPFPQRSGGGGVPRVSDWQPVVFAATWKACWARLQQHMARKGLRHVHPAIMYRGAHPSDGAVQLRAQPSPEEGQTDGRLCEACGRLLVRRKHETTDRWRKRRTCSKACGGEIRRGKKPAKAS